MGEGDYKLPPTCRSVRDLAKAVEKSHTAVGKWVKRADWPFSRKPPWKRDQLPAIMRWAADTLAPNTHADPADDQADNTAALRRQKLQQEIRKLRANADQAETALAKERGQLLDAGEVERAWANIAVVVRNGAQNLASQVVPLALSHGMPHEAAGAFQEQVEQAVAGVLRHLSRDGSASDDGVGDEG
jgi:hypothetical protein